MVVIHTDGGLVPPMLCVVVSEVPLGKPERVLYRCTTPGISHHEIEYLAIIFGLSSVLFNNSDVHIITDSRLITGHLDWGWNMNEKFVPYKEIINEICDEKNLSFIIDHIYRGHNPAGKRLESLKRYYKRNKTIVGFKYIEGK